MDKLFKKYQKELLAFANTSFGRSYIGHSGKEAYDKYPIVKIYRSGFVQLVGFKGKQPILRLSTYPGTRRQGEIHDKLFGTILTKLEIADKYRIKNPKELPFVIPHFMGETQRLSNQLPQIFLTDTTFNPQAGTGGANVTVDGTVRHGSVDVNWATIRAAAGNNSDATNTGNTRAITYMECSTTSNQYVFLDRSIFTLNTAALTADATISAATFSYYGRAKADAGGLAPTTNVYASTPAADNALANGDFAQTGTTAYSDTAVTYANYSTTGYNDWALNATGLAAISLTGITKVSLKNANFDVGNSAPTWASGRYYELYGYFADAGENLPKLVVTYTLPATTVVGYSYFM